MRKTRHWLILQISSLISFASFTIHKAARHDNTACLFDETEGHSCSANVSVQVKLPIHEKSILLIYKIVSLRECLSMLMGWKGEKRSCSLFHLLCKVWARYRHTRQLCIGNETMSCPSTSNQSVPISTFAMPMAWNSHAPSRWLSYYILFVEDRRTNLTG